MKSVVRSFFQDLKPFLWYLLAGMAFTLMMWLATGARTPTGEGPGYWDDEDRAGQMVEEQYREEIDQEQKRYKHYAKTYRIAICE